MIGPRRSLLTANIDTGLFFNNPHQSDFVKDLIRSDKRIIPYSPLEENFVEEDTYSFYVVNKNNIFIPYNLPDIGHQISHMVEMRDLSRCLKVNWGMRHNTVKSTNEFSKFSDSALLAATARECRVRAIDSVLNKSNVRKNVVWNEHVEGDIADRLPLGKFKDIEHMRQWYMNLFETTAKKWSLERIRHEWMVRINYIQEWMETRAAA